MSDDKDTVLKCDRMKWTSTKGRDLAKVDIGGHREKGGENNARILWTSFTDGCFWRLF